MLVRQIIETKEYFSNDTKPGYFVIYEKIRQNNVVLKIFGVEESRSVIEEKVRILKGSNQYSLSNVKDYQVGIEYASIEDALSALKENECDIFQTIEAH